MMSAAAQELTIESLGQHGDGRSACGQYIPRVLPGEVITANISADGPQDVRVITPSPERVRPQCRHYKTCGGCQLQHGSDAFVARWKQELVAEQLARKDLHPQMRPIATSPSGTRRRASISARRTKSGAMAGFHMRGSDVLVDVQDCPVLEPQLNKGLEIVRHLARIGASRKSELSVLVTSGTDGLDLSVSGGKPLDDVLRMALPDALRAYPVARLTWDGRFVFQIAAPRISIAGLHVTPPADTFLQATEHGEKTLQKTVLEIISDAKSVADLFSGCGTFALSLAQGRKIRAFDAQADMLEAMEHAANRAGLGFDLVATRRNLFSDPLTPPELSVFDAVVIDPPRAGAAAQVCEIAASQVSRVAYVSCDPASFARDARVLCDGGYKLDWVQVVDQFRWSPHVELAASFRKP